MKSIDQHVSATRIKSVVDDGVSLAAPGATISMRSVAHLQQVESQSDEEGRGIGKKLKAAVVAALLGIALLGVTSTAQAQDTAPLSLPQTSGLFLDHQPTGPPGDFAKVLGTTTTRSAAVDTQTKAALDVFQTRLAQILHADAGSLASGLTPTRAGSTLDATQQKDIERAVTDLLKSMPIGAFSPGVQNTLSQALGALGDHRDLSTMRLGDLGKAGGDAVSALVKDFKAEHPKAFWSLAGVGAGAAVAVGYTQGTAALEKLGLKPEFSTGIFKDTKLSLGVQAGVHFADPRFNIGLDTQHTFQGGSVLKGGVAAQLKGKELVSADLHGSLSTTSGFNVDGKLQLDGKGKPFDARLSASQTFTHDVGGGGTGVLFANAQWADGSHGTQAGSSLNAGIAATHGRWTSQLSGGYDFHNDRFSSSLSAGRTFDIHHKNDLDVQIRATIDNKGNSSVGAGVTFHF
ncbi:MAG: hypothetical protein Q8O67_15730 [Deltaproteobacteria bacterium]|nr:hypothetical protein [Deltaproteobacteria bacterium]